MSGSSGSVGREQMGVEELVAPGSAGPWTLGPIATDRRRAPTETRVTKGGVGDAGVGEGGEEGREPNHRFIIMQA